MSLHTSHAEVSCELTYSGAPLLGMSSAFTLEPHMASLTHVNSELTHRSFSSCLLSVPSYSPLTLFQLWNVTQILKPYFCTRNTMLESRKYNYFQSKYISNCLIFLKHRHYLLQWIWERHQRYPWSIMHYRKLGRGCENRLRHKGFTTPILQVYALFLFFIYPLFLSDFIIFF